MADEQLMYINRIEFLQGLETVRAGLAPKGIVEQSDCFIFRNGEVATFNGDVTCRAKSGFPHKFTAAMPAQALLKIVAKLEEDELKVEEGDGETHFKGKGKWFSVTSVEKIVLPLDKVAYPDDWHQLPPDFNEALQLVQDCAGKDASKFIATCIHITPDHMEATDGYRMAQYRTKLPVKRDYLVKRDSIKSVVPLDMTEMGETDDWVHFRNASGLYFACRRFIEQFPDISGKLNVKGQEISLPKGLIEGCERANIFTEEQAEANEVEVVVGPGKVKLRAQGITGRYYESRDTDYDGDLVAFRIPPDLLASLIKKYNTCIIGRDRLLVTGPQFDLVSAIGSPEG